MSTIVLQTSRAGLLGQISNSYDEHLHHDDRFMFLGPMLTTLSNPTTKICLPYSAAVATKACLEAMLFLASNASGAAAHPADSYFPKRQEDLYNCLLYCMTCAR